MGRWVEGAAIFANIILIAGIKIYVDADNNGSFAAPSPTLGEAIVRLVI